MLTRISQVGTYGTKTAMWAYDGDRFHRVLKALAQGFGLGHSGAEVEVSALDGPWPPHLQGSRNARPGGGRGRGDATSANSHETRWAAVGLAAFQGFLKPGQRDGFGLTFVSEFSVLCLTDPC